MCPDLAGEQSNGVGRSRDLGGQLAREQSQPSGRVSATKDSGDPRVGILGTPLGRVLAALQEGMQVLRRDLEKGKAQGSPRGAGEGVRAAPQPLGSR